MTTPLKLIRKPVDDMKLIDQSVRAHPANESHQLKWRKAIQFLRTTKAGWLLERVHRKPPTTL